jgi:hypothetical protein
MTHGSRQVLHEEVSDQVTNTASRSVRTSLGTGWSGRRSLVGVGNFDRQGVPDLMAIVSSTGVLSLYPGRSGGPLPPVRLSGGWSGRGSSSD